jgi:1,2-diacylglycerol 3-beta-galactosyltransferase
MNPPPKSKRFLFLFSDTGGGHRSAAEAISEALQLEFPEIPMEIEMIDILREYGTLLFKYAPIQYPYIVKMPLAWEAGYDILNKPRRVRTISDALWPALRRSLHNLLTEHPSDLIVSVHPLPNMAMLRAMGKKHRLYATVVTDMVSTHALWYEPKADLVIVPTQAAFESGLELGMPPQKMEVIGMPVADRFCLPVGDRVANRAQLGWPEEGPTILIVGGGEGMGPLEAVVRGVSEARLKANVVVIAGRNDELRAQLTQTNWNIPVKVYGYVKTMPEFMRASDILITKAGPGSISEGFLAGLPMILYHYLPGQEKGNVEYVVNNGAGIWAPDPGQIVSALRIWLDDPAVFNRFSEGSSHLARPLATRQIARRLMDLTA